MDNTRPFSPLQQEEQLLISCPEFTLWDVGLDDVLQHPEGSPEVMMERVGLVDNRKGKKLEEIDGRTPDKDVQKKMIHRDFERQRRQDMASLYASLRSVLPTEILKGKRSISDQIHEATKYIMYLQGNITELGSKRDKYKLKITHQNDLSSDSEKRSSSKSLPIVVTAERCSVGVEVLISGHFMAEGVITLPLSRILQLLLEEGLNAVSCNCAKFDGRLHYMIQCEVLGYPGVDLQMLRRKLLGMINNLIDIK